MDPVVLHLSDVPSLPGRLAIGTVAGLLAAVVTNVPMQRLPEGTTPPFVVAGALAGEPLDEVDPRLASASHYLGGSLGGALFALVAVGLEAVLPFTAVIAGVGLRLVPHVLAALVTVAVAVAGFAYVVLPLWGGEATERAPRVRSSWVLSVTVYTLALSLFVPLLVAAV